MESVTFEYFAAIDIRVGRVIEGDDFPQARRPAWRLRIDFGPQIGLKISSAKITHYSRAELLNRLILAVVNLPPRQIGPVRSEVLVLAAYSDKGVLPVAADSTRDLGDRLG